MPAATVRHLKERPHMTRHSAAVALAFIPLLATGPAGAQEPASELRPTLTLQVDEGWVVFDPNHDGFAYRYGPSIMLNPDGTMDAWFASPGGPGADGQHQWDWIRHKRSADGGHSWGPESVVLKPTEGSRDQQSVCDPGVIKLGDWYYLGVTAVEDPAGNCNEVFVARSQAPEGPFEKWNGEGWGGAPQPIVAFRAPVDVWGAGEPSFVRKGDTLYIYYTIISRNAAGEGLNQTHVACAPADDPDWPGKITDLGLAFDRAEGEDSADVKYVEALDRFISLSTASRFSAESYLMLRESVDGVHWTPGRPLRESLVPWLHNCGLSGTPEGHFDPALSNVLGYAYSKDGGVSWGFWFTRMHPVKLLPLGH
jgi:hypothetical protein